MDRNENYWIKNARERYKFMSKSDFHTTTALKLQVRVLVFSVLNASEFKDDFQSVLRSLRA